MNRYHFFSIVLILIQTAFIKSAGTVVLLRGTGSAGKTSLCSTLLRLDSSWKCIEEDAICYQESEARWREEFPEEFGIIQEAIDTMNIFHALTRDQLLFKSE